MKTIYFTDRGPIEVNEKESPLELGLQGRPLATSSLLKSLLILCTIEETSV